MTSAAADSLDQIANVYIKDGLNLRPLEFSTTVTGLKTHGDKKNKARTDRFGDCLLYTSPSQRDS